MKSGDGISGVYRKTAPHVDGETVELEWIGSLAFGTEPSAEARRRRRQASRRMARGSIRTYSDAYLWRRPENIPVGLMLTGDPCDPRGPREDQGEAIAFRADGSGYITVSEDCIPPSSRKTSRHDAMPAAAASGLLLACTPQWDVGDEIEDDSGDTDVEDGDSLDEWSIEETSQSPRTPSSTRA